MLLSIHDYFIVCPSTHLLDGDGVFCGGDCTPAMGQCRIPIKWMGDLPVLKDGFLERWRDKMAAVVATVDQCVTTSEFVRELVGRVYSQGAAKKTVVIEHGRDFNGQGSCAVPPQPGGEIRLVAFGYLGLHKGIGVLRDLVEIDRQHNRRLDVHLIGETPGYDAGAIGTWHGPYRRHQLETLMESIRPSFAVLLSSWAETYSHTLTEAWALGLPALVGRLGAPALRVNEHGGGWVLDERDAMSCYRTILEIADDPKEFRRGLASARIEGIPSCDHMGSSYLRLYRELSSE
jgi:glycosyltransferase involved in cell wall biosynthesis